MPLKTSALLATIVCLLGLMATPAVAQTPFTYDTSRLPANLIGGGIGGRLSTTPNPLVSNAAGFGFYAHQVSGTPGLFQYNQATFQGNTVTVSAGMSAYVGTLFNKVSCFAAGSGGASFTLTAIGQAFPLGGDCFLGVHKTTPGNKFIIGAGGNRVLSNQAQIDGYDAHFTVAYTF